MTPRAALARRLPKEVNDALDLAECAVHDQIHDPIERDWVKSILAELREAARALVVEPVEIRLGNMVESNGRETWIVSLARSADDSPFDALQVYASEIKGRAEYERDRLLHFFGQGPEPDLLSYDTDAHPSPAGLEQARLTAIEAAAQACEIVDIEWRSKTEHGSYACQACAAAIRALSTPSPKEELCNCEEAGLADYFCKERVTDRHTGRCRLSPKEME